MAAYLYLLTLQSKRDMLKARDGAQSSNVSRSWSPFWCSNRGRIEQSRVSVNGHDDWDKWRIAGYSWNYWLRYIVFEKRHIPSDATDGIVFSLRKSNLTMQCACVSILTPRAWPGLCLVQRPPAGLFAIWCGSSRGACTPQTFVGRVLSEGGQCHCMACIVDFMSAPSVSRQECFTFKLCRFLWRLLRRSPHTDGRPAQPFLKQRRGFKGAMRVTGTSFSRTCIFCFLTLSLLWSSLFYSSLLSDSSHLCFSSVHIVGSLTSKLPSLKNLYLKHI